MYMTAYLKEIHNVMKSITAHIFREATEKGVARRIFSIYFHCSEEVENEKEQDIEEYTESLNLLRVNTI